MPSSRLPSLRRIESRITLTFYLALVLAPTSVCRADIVFSAQIMGPVSNIYSITDNGQLTKLTDNIQWRDMDALSIAGNHIAFSSNREENPKIDLQKSSENFDIYIVNTSNRKVQRITDYPGHDTSPKFSPDEEWIAYLRQADGKYELRLFNRTNNVEKILAITDDIFDFSWSPDSKKISFAALTGNRSALNISAIESGETQVLLSTSIMPETKENGGFEHYQTQITASAWSPDGGKIAYILHPLKQGVRQLRVFDIGAKLHSNISPETTQAQQPVTWAKDSKSLLYAALVGYKFWYDEKTHKKVYEGGMHIFISDLAGKTAQITQGDHLFKNPVYSPDNKQIAFFYADTLDERTLKLKTMNADGSKIRQLHDAASSRSSLIWY